MIKITDIHWIAGLIEGEGTFIVESNGTTPQIRVAMTDLDIVERFQRITNSGKIGISERGEHKTIYLSAISLTPAISWMMTIYPLMGLRRRARIREILFLWRDHVKIITTHCRNGHEYTEENSYIYKNLKTGYTKRLCKACQYERTKEFRKPEVRVIKGFKKLGLSQEQIETIMNKKENAS